MIVEDINNKQTARMRWKLYGDVRENPYKCCWFIHVRTGTVLLGLYSLVMRQPFCENVGHFTHCVVELGLETSIKLTHR